MKRIINYWKYTKSIWFMLRMFIAWILMNMNRIFNSDKILTIASNICTKEYIFNTPFWKYIWASLYWYSQMNEDYESEVKNIVDEYSYKLRNGSDKYLLNIWCNIWRWAIYLSKKYNYKVIAFEPAPETYYRFRTNIAFSWLLDMFETYNIWLWNENWLMKFEYNIKSNWSAHIIKDGNTNKDVLMIPVKKFDDLKIEKEKIENTRLIIMDVEWFEYDALRWMEKNLKNFHDVSIIVEIWEHQKNKENTLDFMKNLWYSIEKIWNEDYLFKK